MRLGYKLFSVCMIATLLVACGGHSPAPVTDRSTVSRSVPQSNGYIVQKGDTLYSIAFRYGLNYRDVAAINGIDKNFSIYPGQRIKLTGPVPVVKKTTVVKKAHSSSPSRKTSTAVAKQKQSPVKKTTANTVKKRFNAVSGPVRWQWPVNGKIIQGFRSKGQVNKGINIAGSKGTAVKAAATGRVVYSGSGLLGYGNLIIVDHNQQFLSAYAHNSRVLVKENDMVKAGEKIAEMGSSGADRVMLHFEIRRDGKPLDPLRFLPKK